MKKRSMVTLQLPRAHLFVLLAVLTILLGVGLGIAQSPSVNTSLPWHPLQQVAKGSGDITSVDASGNNVIDEADNAAKVGGIDPGTFCKVGDTRTGCASGTAPTGTGPVLDAMLVQCDVRGGQVPSQACNCVAPYVRRGSPILTQGSCVTTACVSNFVMLCVKK